MKLSRRVQLPRPWRHAGPRRRRAAPRAALPQRHPPGAHRRGRRPAGRRAGDRVRRSTCARRPRRSRRAVDRWPGAGLLRERPAGRRRLTRGRTGELTVTQYLDHLEHDPNLVVAVELVASVVHRPTVLHCAAGKDRTGVVTALVLGPARRGRRADHRRLHGHGHAHGPDHRAVRAVAAVPAQHGEPARRDLPRGGAHHPHLPARAGPPLRRRGRAGPGPRASTRTRSAGSPPPCSTAAEPDRAPWADFAPRRRGAR